MIDAFLTSVHPEKVRDILAPSLIYYSRWPVRIFCTTPVFDRPKIPRVTWIGCSLDVMPAQEMALRQCQGPYVLHAVDDLRYDPGTIDALVDELERGEKIIASPTYYHYNAPEMRAHHPGIFIGVPGDPMEQPMNGLYRLSDVQSFLPYDPQFQADYGFTDLSLRMQSQGWRVKRVAHRVYDTGVTDGDSLWSRRGHLDWEKIKHKWAPGGKIDHRLCQLTK